MTTGDIDLEEVCRRYGGSVLRRCRAILGDADEAQDAAQEVFLMIMQKGGQLREPAGMAAWIYRLATHHCLNHLRANRRRTTREAHRAVASWQDRPAPRPDAADGLKHLLWEVGGGQDELGQQIFVYRYLDGMTQEEIAVLTQRSRRTVGKRLGKIEAQLAALRKELR